MISLYPVVAVLLGDMRCGRDQFFENPQVRAGLNGDRVQLNDGRVQLNNGRVVRGRAVTLLTSASRWVNLGLMLPSNRRSTTAMAVGLSEANACPTGSCSRTYCATISSRTRLACVTSGRLVTIPSTARLACVMLQWDT